MFVLVLLNLAWIGFEGLGVALLLPIFELLRSGGHIAFDQLPGRHWEIIRSVTGSLNIPISLGLLLTVSFSLMILRQLFNYLNTLYFGVTMRSTAHSIRRRCFAGFLRAESSLHDSSRAGEIANDLTIELDRALSSLFCALRAFGIAIQMLVYIGGLFLLSPVLTLLSIGVFGVIGVLSRGLFAGVKQVGASITAANVQLTSFIVERLQRARLIRLSGSEKAECAAFAKLSHRQAQQKVRQKLIMTRMTLLPEPIALGFAYLVLFLGGEVFGFSLELLGLFLIVLVRLMPVVQGALSNYNNIVGDWPSVRKVDAFLAALIEAREPRGGDKVFDKLDLGISYTQVSFSYVGSETPALRDVTVSLPAHRISALVGPSGAGKSTFVDLLPRLRDPTAGEIRFDGIPITEFSMDSLRTGIAFVPQQPQIFNVTAAEHIRYGKEDASDDEVREAARLADAVSFIEALPQGFDTLLGDGGARLSGGQRQRLDIARALVRRAPILILDEPTSALDADSEAAFRGALKALRSETSLTIIVIAHRLSTIADADQVVVLRQGRVEAVGSHTELMRGGNWYAKAFQKQHGAQETTSAVVADHGQRLEA